MSQKRIISLIQHAEGLGYLHEDSTFKVMTNWVPSVVAIVRENGTLEGCIIEHAPKTVVDAMEKRYVPHSSDCLIIYFVFVNLKKSHTFSRVVLLGYILMAHTAAR